MLFIDWVVVAIYFAVIIFIGMKYYKRASSNLEEYFISGRKLTWWIAGTSMVATTFAADTPLAVTGLTLNRGISGNWLWWSMALTSMLTVIFFSKMWRRSGIMTDVEFAELRYSGKPAAFLRGFRALYLGIPINVIIMGGFVTVAMIKIIQYMLFDGQPLSIEYKLLIVGGAFVIAGLYSIVSGLWGVVITDFVQFFLAMIGSIALAVISVDKAGGLSKMTAKISQTRPDLLSFFPDPGSALFITVAVYLTVQWWASWYPGAEPGGGGYAAQRMFSCKDEKHSFLSSLWFTIAHYAVRPWPWIITALAAFVLIPGVADKEAMYPMMIARYMPAGLKGLMLTAFLAAYMSTITTHLNWGASYVVNDFYKRFIRKDRDDKHYVLVSRLVTLGLMLLSAIPAILFDSIKDAWLYILTIGAGTGMVLILRWFWHRINAYSEISAMLSSLIVSTVLIVVKKVYGLSFSKYGPLDDSITLAVTVGITTIVWITVTLLTKPESPEKLTAFFNKVRPAGVMFRPQTAQGYQSKVRLMPLLIQWILGCIMVFSFLFGTGMILLSQMNYGSYIGIGLLVLGVFLFRFIAKKAEA